MVLWQIEKVMDRQGACIAVAVLLWCHSRSGCTPRDSLRLRSRDSHWPADKAYQLRCIPGTVEEAKQTLFSHLAAGENSCLVLSFGSHVVTSSFDKAHNNFPSVS